MAFYLIVEMLPYLDVDAHPSGEFSPGRGFESELSEFIVVGPEFSPKDIETDSLRYESEGYSVFLLQTEIA